MQTLALSRWQMCRPASPDKSVALPGTNPVPTSEMPGSAPISRESQGPRSSHAVMTASQSRLIVSVPRRPARPSRQRSSAVRRFRDAWLTATGRHRSMREAAARDERADTPKVERVSGAKAEARKGEAEPPRERKKECAAAVRLRADALWRDRQASADATMRAQCAVGPKVERGSRAK